ncbi:MAG: ATP-binding protein [Acidobacteria bacterium]|nr:ATP-binding protein [Acidobacteriota bacterium]
MPPDHDDTPVEFACAELAVRLDLELPGEASAISPVVERVLTLVRDTGCARGKEFEVETALREALANAVRYGCAHNPSKTVQLSVACDQARGMMIVVRDPGPGFDPSQVPSPVAGDQLYADHGRGIYLISQLMDHVEYGRGGTEIRMIKR